MCGRFAFFSLTPEVFHQFGLAAAPAGWQPRYNIAPRQPAAVVRDEGGRRMELMRWGLVPHWAREASIGNRLINARAESVASKPSFREAFQRRRCLIPADGFFEWQNEGRRPYFIRPAGGGVFGLAGLWEVWQRGKEPLYTFTIITCPASAQLQHLHQRMPVILAPQHYPAWLETTPGGAGDLADLLKPWEGKLELRPVSPRVNNATFDDPSVVEPAPPPTISSS
jgi:putative SOS response-associated peptidase YedK